MAAVTIALERQLLIVTGTRPFRIDTTAGTVEVTVRLGAGPAAADRVTRVCGVTYRTPPVHVVQAALPVMLEGRPLRVDVVWAQGYYAVVDREAIGLPTDPGVPERLRRRAVNLIETLQPEARGWATTGRRGRVDGVVLTGPPTRPDADLRSMTVYRDGTIDRSPSGAGTAAVLALLDAMGLVNEGQVLGHEGMCGGVFRARVGERVAGDTRGAIVPEISGEAWITGEHTFLLDPEDPFREGVAT
jgi:proline racemase